ncbi:MAG: T9SS type A sorting domain-containing protein [Bacteroidetes bacterium]|nr:T9SS type A sorting domain-containing protein [Bacteroidota bacterium]
MKPIFTITLILLLKTSFGQILFNKSYSKQHDDLINAVIERYDGKYLIAGSSYSQFTTDFDVNIMLVDSVGNLIWDKYIGQSPRMEFAYSLIETKDSNYVISGKVASNDPYLLKFDSAGNFLWAKEYPTQLYSYGGRSVGQTFDSNYYFISHDTLSTLYLTNTFGDTIWTRKYESVILESVVQTSDSGFIMTGNSDPTLTNQDICLVKTNSNGNTLWTKTFGGGGFDRATCVQQLSDNGFIIVGNYDAQIIDGDWQTYIIRTNSVGDTIWTQNHYLGESNYIAECKNNTGYILSSKEYIPMMFPYPERYSLVITKLDTAGVREWSKRFDGYYYEFGNDIAQTSDGGYLLTGYVDYGISFADAVLIKLDSAGNFVLSVIDVSNSKTSHVLVFPNPAINEINFEIGDSKSNIKQLKVLNSLGQEMLLIGNINERQFKLDIKSLSVGLYFYQLITSGNQIETGKFIVEE